MGAMVMMMKKKSSSEITLDECLSTIVELIDFIGAANLKASDPISKYQVNYIRRNFEKVIAYTVEIYYILR